MQVCCPRCSSHWGTPESGLQPYEYTFMMQVPAPHWIACFVFPLLRSRCIIPYSRPAGAENVRVLRLPTSIRLHVCGAPLPALPGRGVLPPEEIPHTGQVHELQAVLRLPAVHGECLAVQQRLFRRLTRLRPPCRRGLVSRQRFVSNCSSEQPSGSRRTIRTYLVSRQAKRGE